MELTRLYVHPLKSGRGWMPAQASVTPQGLQHDRVWLVVRPDGSQITARTHSQLVQVSVSGGHTEDWTFTAPGQALLHTNTARFTDRHPAQVWRTDFTALAGDGQADAWFSQWLGEPVRLLWLGQSTRPQKSGGDTLSFADGYPYLLISEASLADLNERLAAKVDMRQFRPNLVVDDTFAFEEDEWQRLRIGEVEFEVQSRCTRCVFTTIHPDTAERHPQQQPLATLARYRRFDEGVCFGVNLVARNAGTVKLGDPVTVLSRREVFD